MSSRSDPARASRHRSRTRPRASTGAALASPRANAFNLREWVYAALGPGFILEFLLYFVALTMAEVVTVLVDTRTGIAAHAVILAFVMAKGSLLAFGAGVTDALPQRSIERRKANLFIALSLVPLIRIVSLALPLDKFPVWTWYGLIGLPLILASIAAARACGYSRAEVGLRVEMRPIWWLATLAVAAFGVVLGFIEYRILEPEPLVALDSVVTVAAASVTILIGTGLTEELIFRGVALRAGIEGFGVPLGLTYCSALFAVLHVGHRSGMDVVFVFLVAILFSLITLRSRSLLGVTLAHGITNICLFIVFPHIFAK